MEDKHKVKDKISVIIPVYNGISFTKACLKNMYALFSQSGIQSAEFEVIVVDDGSSDSTADWIRDNYPSVHLLYGDGGLWWSGGINRGVTYALENLKTDYILWWNNDIIPANDYFIQVARLIRENGDNVLIGSKVFVLNNNLIWAMGCRFDPVYGKRYLHGSQQPDSEAFCKPFEADWFPGMGTIMHRSVFEKIGLLDNKNFPQYHGDSDFTYRAKKAGFRLIAFPELVIFNDTTNTGMIHTGSFSNLYKSMISIKSNFNLNKDFVFYKKHAESPFAYIYLINKYFRYIGGFCKWKFLNYFGIKKHENAGETNEKKSLSIPEKQP